MKFDREADETLSIDMTPMVDCIFAIILFLVATSAIQESLEQDISINLPTHGRAVAQPKAPPSPPVVVNVRYVPGGKALFNIENNPVSVNQMENFLSVKKVANREQAVVIRGDKNVKWDHVAAVMSVCGRVGIKNISASVAVQEESTQ